MRSQHAAEFAEAFTSQRGIIGNGLNRNRTRLDVQDELQQSASTTTELISTVSSNQLIVTASSDVLNDNQDYHVAFTYDGSSTGSGVSQYVDGVEVATTSSGTLSATIQNGTSGVDCALTLLAGSIFQVACAMPASSIALTPAEVASIAGRGNDVASGLLPMEDEREERVDAVRFKRQRLPRDRNRMTSGELWANTQDTYHAALMRHSHRAG